LPALLEEADNGLVALPVGIGEVVRKMRVDIENADRPTGGVTNRYDDLRPTSRIAGNVARESLDIVHQARLVAVDPRPADSLVTLEHETRHRALIGLDDQIFATQEIEPGPRDPGHLVVQECDRGRPVSDRIIGLGDETENLGCESFKEVSKCVVVHNSIQM
jgi:hypothetical protein